VKRYEELTGARGREMFYRAERFKAAHLFKRGAPALNLEADPFILHDISLTGLGAMTTHGANYVRGVGQPVAVQLKVNEEALFEARGEIVRTESIPRGTKVGVRFLDHSVDMARVVTRYQKLKTQADLDELAVADAPVGLAYRQLCADMLHLLRTYRATLDSFEATNPDAGTANEMLAACVERVLPRWRELWERGNELVTTTMDPSGPAWRAAKRYTELLLTPDFLAGASWRRAYQKPLGYPGDFELMNIVYDWKLEGERLSDKLIHRIGLDFGECIATRMIMMRQTIAEVVSSAGSSPTRITSLGCGSAREVIDYLKAPALPRKLEVTLIDQDHRALSQAYERSLPEVMRHRAQATVSCLHASFSQLLAAGELVGKLPAQDMIYSVGLIDYLTARRAKALIKSLYEHLVPGGRLVVGNMRSGQRSTLWPLEFITDWTLIYRDETEMLDLGAELPGATLSVDQNSTGNVCVLTVRKP
jgi:extracellular factor (EF) 3-hydroxypalmitic acid methyl ester biosynthesis protein